MATNDFEQQIAELFREIERLAGEVRAQESLSAQQLAALNRIDSVASVGLHATRYLASDERLVAAAGG